MLYISNFKTIKIEYYALLFLGFTLFCFIMVPPDVSKHKAYSVGELIPYKYGDDSEDSQYRFYVKKEDFISSSFSGKINEIPYLNIKIALKNSLLNSNITDPKIQLYY
jgi:hypothetical protein